MAIKPSGNPISTSDINVEIGKAATALITLNDTEVRRLMEIPSGQISMGNAFGKSYRFTQTISANTANFNLRAYAVNNGWDQLSAIEITIDANTAITSNTTANSSLVVDGTWPKGVTLINNGIIAGKGGAGGAGGVNSGGAGGTAIFANTNVTIINNGTIGGGGGGGGGGASAALGFPPKLIGGYGGGGGAGYGVGGPGSTTFASAPQASGGNGGLLTGGRDGYVTSTGTPYTGSIQYGSGGSLGQPGIIGGYVSYFPPIGPPITTYGGAGGAAGLAVSGNNYVTWAKTGTILGSRV